MTKDEQIEQVRTWLNQGLDLVGMVAGMWAEPEWKAFYAQCEQAMLEQQKTVLESRRDSLQAELNGVEARLVEIQKAGEF